MNSGEIYVLGGEPGTLGSGVPGPRIGYMPQVRVTKQTLHAKQGNVDTKKKHKLFKSGVKILPF